MANTSQIFQTNNPNRWHRFKWASRLFLLLFPLAIAVVVIAINIRNNNEPDIPLESRVMKKVLNDKTPKYRESKLGNEYRGFRKAIDDKWAKGQGCGQKNNVVDLSNSSLFSDSIGIRAAFYVNWDAKNSLPSLEKNISKLNLVIPEWFFINPVTDRLFTNIDKKALAVMKASGVKIMPILTNNYQKVFRGEVINRILKDNTKSQLLINDILALLKQYDFAGINIDFEELNQETDAPLIAFQKLLYQQLHAANYLVSQDVIPFNDDYNFKALEKYNDYLVLMAYDEHHDESKPGAISSQKWIENAVDKVTKVVPANKIILAMAAYGYDWKLQSNDKADAMTYKQALGNATKYDSKVYYDNHTYNLHYQYISEDDDSLHEVHFTDAATNFNTVRFATESKLAGTVLWRLGGEDNRLWDFYNQATTKAGLSDFNFEHFARLDAGIEPVYTGEGEILDIVATPKPGKLKIELDDDAILISEEYYDTLPSTYVINKFGATKKRKLVLTYDDGPDPKYTREILDTLAYYHVPASFFIVGLEAENNIPLVKRIMREGHEIGNHTFTHPNMALVSKQRAALEMDATRLLIECITGHSTIMFRAPFNADSEPGLYEELEPVALSRAKNYITVGESIDPEDWEKGERLDFNSDTIFNRVVRNYEKRMKHLDDPEDTTGINGSLILLHDAGGDRSETVAATGKIIRYFQSRGYTFTTVADLLGKKPDDVMPPVPRDSGYYWLQFNYVLAEIGYIGGHFFTSLFIVFLTLGAIRLFGLGVLAFLQNKKEKALLKHISIALPSPAPLVSIIVPAYNEEVNAVNSLTNLLLCTYPNFEIIFIDDGSKDATYENVTAAFKNNPNIKIYSKSNAGKASALNFGINQSQADYVVCIDADTKLAPDAVTMLMKNFFAPNAAMIGAVAGTVKVGNEVNLLAKWQSIEYITGQNFDRKAFAYANAIGVIPGAIGAFRKDALMAAGSFTIDTLAEDCDVTIRILRCGYIVANEPKAIAYTEAPEKLGQFMKQRKRWSFGVMQTFWKHKDALFSSKNKMVGWLLLPDILVFKYIIPFFAPFADFLMLIGLLTDNAEKIGKYYLIFMIIDTMIAAIAFAFEKEKPWKLFWLIPQRLLYRWLMMVVLFQTLRKAIKGELQHWGVLKRTGNVKEVVA